MDNSKNYRKPKQISDLNILWAIRDIPRSILNLSQKGILSMFLAIMGNKSSFSLSMKELENKIGLTDANLIKQLHLLEDRCFIKINRPANYVKGQANEYFLNYVFILELADKCRNESFV